MVQSYNELACNFKGLIKHLNMFRIIPKIPSGFEELIK
jgi:hypothetical protein